MPPGKPANRVPCRDSVSRMATYLAMDSQAGDAPPFRKFAFMPTTLQTNQEANS